MGTVAQKRTHSNRSDATRRGRRGYFACRAIQLGVFGRTEARPSRSGRMEDETVRKPTSKPLSVSSRLRALRVNRPEAKQGEGFTTERTETSSGRHGMARRAMFPRRPRRVASERVTPSKFQTPQSPGRAGARPSPLVLHHSPTAQPGTSPRSSFPSTACHPHRPQPIRSQS